MWLLREDYSSDDITFHVRYFQQQKAGTRICGFYATAAALSCCLKSYPTGHFYTVTLLASHFRQCMINETFQEFPKTVANRRGEKVFTTPKRHCICHGLSSGSMLQCSSPYCLTWFHVTCVQITAERLREIKRIPWLCPICSKPRSSKAIVIY